LNNNNTISLKDLKGYSVVPPAFLFDTVKQKIEEDNQHFAKKLQSLFDHTVQPPAMAISFDAIMGRIKQTDELNTFKPLRNYEVAAPFSFAVIMEKIRAILGSSSVVVPMNSAKVISFSDSFKKIAAAAAVLLLCFVGYITFKKVSDNNFIESSNNPIASNTTPSITPPTTTATDTTQAKVDSNVAKNNTTAIVPTFSNRSNNYNSYVSGNNRSKGFGKEIKRRTVLAIPMQEIPVATEMNIGGSTMPIIDNDYLASFAALTETNLPPFLQVEKPVATTITIDDYTYITISEGMGAMMKKMYKTRKSGKPTRRARKTKEKLEKWRKADADYFNQNSTMNPLDPIDLGNFIFNK
jgi:hypothetical protein